MWFWNVSIPLSAILWFLIGTFSAIFIENCLQVSSTGFESGFWWKLFNSYHGWMSTHNEIRCRYRTPTPHTTRTTPNSPLIRTDQQAIAGNVQALCIGDPWHISITTHLVQLQHKFSPAIEDNFDINSRLNRDGNWHHRYNVQNQ